jgi:molecular chaperone GrpE (heat shock protein)/DNA-binding Xre family transcriptional regulator
MSQSSSQDYTQRLRSLMQSVGVSSFKALSQKAGVSEWQVQQLRQGKAAQMRIDPLDKLSQSLQISLLELLTTFSELQLQHFPPPPTSATPHPPSNEVAIALETLQQEYQRLQAQVAQQRETLWQEFQQSCLQALESWLLQFPTAAYAAQHNPQIPATRLLPLMRPIEQLLKDWGVEAIAPVGTELPYDPQCHQLMDGTAQPGDQVRVRYTGYRQGDRLLYRAKVSSIANHSSM